MLSNRGNQADQIIQKKTSQAMIDSGKATISPRAKLRPSIATSSSPPKPAGDFLISSALSQWAIQLIPLNGLGHKVQTAPCLAHRGDSSPFVSSLARSLGDLLMIARLTLEVLLPAEIVKVQAIRIRPLPGQIRARPKTLSPVALLAILLLPRPVLAKEVAKVVTPVDLFEPERGAGTRFAQSLIAFPNLEVDATYDDNIYSTNAAKLDDFVTSIRPRVTIRTDWSRHQIWLSGGADIRRFAEIPAENSEQFDIQGKGTLELAERTEVIADAGFRRGIEQRGTAGDQFLTDEPVAYDRKFGGLLVRRQGGFLELLAEARIAETSYRDTAVNGLPVDLSARDATVKRARVRASAPSSHYSRVFLEASINSVSYDNAAPVSRDSEGYAVLAGMLLHLTDLVNLEVGAGYIHQSFDNPAINKVNAVNFHLQVELTPRPDWEIVASANRAVEPSPRTDVPAIIRSDFSLEAKKALGDRALVSAEVGIVDEKYQGSVRKDQRFYAAAGVHYRLTDRLGLVAKASWHKQDGNALGRDYDGVTATVGVRFRF